MRVFFVLGILMPFLNNIVRAQSPTHRQDSTAKDRGNQKDRGNRDSTRFSRDKAEVLKQVTITARKPVIERLADRTIINVESLLSNTGSNALEVLGNSPGLQVDDDGLISLKGKTGVLVLLDGKSTELSGRDLAVYLKSLPAGVLDKIEIMSNPPARYQASGTGGIINIKTKKNKTNGFSGSITGNLGIGMCGSSNNSLHFSCKQGKWNFFGSLSVAVLNNIFTSDRLRLYYNDDGSFRGSLPQHYYESSNRVTPGFRLGLNYALSKKDRLEIALSGSAAPYNEKGEYHSRFLNARGQTDSTMVVKSHLKNNNKDGSLGILYRHPFSSEGQEFTTGLNYTTSRLKQNQLLTSSLYNPDHSLKSTQDLLPRQPFTEETYMAKADLSKTLGSLKTETGWSSIHGKADNQSFFATRVNDNAPIDSSWSNHFRYTETIHAVYASLTREWMAFSIQAGLRLENTLSRGQATENQSIPGTSILNGPDTSFTRRYTNLFPTLYFSFHTDSLLTHQFFLSAGRRINRPDYGSLNPSRFFWDRSNFSTGNPLLQPEFSNTTELSYVYRQNFTTSIGYTDTRNLIMQTFRQQGDYFVSMPGNIGRGASLEIDAGISLPVVKGWTAIVYAEFVYNSYRQIETTSGGNNPVTGIRINPNGDYWRISVNNQFRFGHGWSAELSCFYRTRFVQVQSIIQPVRYMNVAVQKKIMKDKCVVNLGLRDIFYSRVFKKEINTLSHQDYFYTNRQDTRVVSLSLTVPFGNSGKNKNNSRMSDPKTEIDRLKNIR